MLLFGVVALSTGRVTTLQLYLAAVAAQQQGRQLCMHAWGPVIRKHAMRMRQAGEQHWLTTLKASLTRLDVPVEGWTMHCCRRGGAADMLGFDGLKAMLSIGGWKTLHFGFPYTPAEEVKMHMMANLRISVFRDE